MSQDLYTISLIISCLALIVSAATAWLTLFRKGKLVMTMPTVVFFGPDGSAFESQNNKVYLRTLLYSTAKKGQVIESLHISLQRNESKQNFNIWVYGEKGDLKRGSGLFIPQEGVTFDHHFLLPEDGANFKFLSGTYSLVVYAKIVGNSSIQQLSSVNLSISENQESQLSKQNTGIYFDWGPDQQSYYSHVSTRPEQELDLESKLFDLMNKKRILTQSTLD
ncbi:hypothetical protein [Litoribacillus peritrichatus]|uniref:SMODS-associating 2TM beta-strand rich effector domain-containing protein n=1 Tax=Litoribacillus peritrichatus TaxID=718191 RepID=A0ABP7MQT6_9GAMM